ncbi:hypothetical protein ALC60_08932 [Trachymyrmex zeteki]|uniref:Uncharacterized protein n=1 Tax=Mycetomoellerius zeteki TaxID=64791 RepID=A0A151WVP5_9HYME|nr:hypothetical protein ALC60_08932 [Trachymyrmex zeteki]
MEGESESACTAAKKLKLSEENHGIEVNESFGYHVINFVAVFSALSEVLVCKQCGKNVTFTQASKKIYINSCSLINNAYEVNRRIIFAFLSQRKLFVRNVLQKQVKIMFIKKGQMNGITVSGDSGARFWLALPTRSAWWGKSGDSYR